MVPSAMLAPRTFGASTERGQNAVQTRARLPGAAYRPLALAMRVTPARTAARAPLAQKAHIKTRKETTGAPIVESIHTPLRRLLLMRPLAPAVQATRSRQREVTRKSTVHVTLATLGPTAIHATPALLARTRPILALPCARHAQKTLGPTSRMPMRIPARTVRHTRHLRRVALR
jgi:hypothetical protein